jgi:tetratricopeptide (TPR) repeat protein
MPPYQPPPAEPVFAPQSPVPVPPQPQPVPAPVYPPQPSEPDSWGETGFTGADDDVVEKWKKRGRRKWFIIIPSLVMVAGVGVWYLVSPESFMGVIRSIAGQPATISEAAVTQYNSGRAHFLKDSDGELDLAVRDLNAAVSAAEGKYPEAMAVLGEVYVTRASKHDLRIGLLDRKIAALDEQIKVLKPKDGSEPKGEDKKKIAPLHNQKVEVQKERNVLVDAARKDLDEAKRYIDAAKEADPQAFAPKRARADYLRVLKAGQGQVEQPLKEAQNIQPDDPQLLYVEGALYAGDPATLDTAAAKLTRAVELMPELVRARYLLAEVLIKQKRPDDARVHLQRIVQESPDHELAKDLLATLEKPAEPKKEEKPKEPGQPDTYEGWIKLARGLQDREQAKKALEAFDAALRLQPDDPTALTGKGFCFFDLGQLRNAIQAFRQALKHNPRQGGAIIGLAEVYKDMGDKTNALEFYQRYLEVLPSGPEAAVAERNIKELQ